VTRRLAELALWVVALGVLTVAMIAVRPRLNEAHVALAYLLIVLGASARGGRTFGLAIAGGAFILFDWFFLPPYNNLIVANPLDWLVLAAFFATSFVAAQLLYRAQSEADRAQRRAAEIDRLAALGAESLNAGQPQDALFAVADVMRTTLGVDQCVIFPREAPPSIAQSPPNVPADRTISPGLVSWVFQHGTEAVLSADGTTRLAWEGPARLETLPSARALLLPLRVRERNVGVLAIVRDEGLRLDAEARRVLDALSYYAALGVERARLVADAQHAEALRQADRLKDALIASVSHDLRTPLTTIKALAHDIANVGDERANIIEQEADRLNEFVANLLDLSRIQAGSWSPSPEPNEAEDLVGAALQRVAGPLGDRTINVSLDNANPILIGRFDFTAALRALVNLLDNAIKYAPPPAPIELSVRRDGDMIAFAVADSGPGVPESDVERVFEPFYRPRGTPPDIGGAGLGLSIARGLIEMQGGTLRYTPRPGGGSIFTVRVPLLEVPSS
jgi:two-component system, OmpR family, sensor histidine kinase KdpD